MKISLSEGTWDKSNVDIVALAIPSGKTNFNRALGRIEVVTGKGSIKPLASDERFEGKPTQTLKVAAGGKAKSRWLLLVGIGDSKDAQRIAWNLGHALATTAGAQKSGAVELPEVTAESVRAASQGLVAGAYRYTEYKSDKAADCDARVRRDSRCAQGRSGPQCRCASRQGHRRERQLRARFGELSPERFESGHLGTRCVERIQKARAVLSRLEQDPHREGRDEPLARGEQGKRHRAESGSRRLQARTCEEESRIRR